MPITGLPGECYPHSHSTTTEITLDNNFEPSSLFSTFLWQHHGQFESQQVPLSALNSVAIFFLAIFQSCDVDSAHSEFCLFVLNLSSTPRLSSKYLYNVLINPRIASSLPLPLLNSFPYYKSFSFLFFCSKTYFSSSFCFASTFLFNLPTASSTFLQLSPMVLPLSTSNLIPIDDICQRSRRNRLPLVKITSIEKKRRTKCR